MRTRKVGTLTLGVMLVAFGALFLVHLLGGLLSYRLIFNLWPVVFICLGVEVLLSMIPKTEGKFELDGKAVVLLVILMLFAMAMAGADVCLRWMEQGGYFM